MGTQQQNENSSQVKGNSNRGTTSIDEDKQSNVVSHAKEGLDSASEGGDDDEEKDLGADGGTSSSEQQQGAGKQSDQNS